MGLKLTISINIFLKTERIFIILLIMGHFFCLRLAVKLEILVLLNNVIGSLSSRRSSDGDSDRAAEMKKKKKRRLPVSAPRWRINFLSAPDHK